MQNEFSFPNQPLKLSLCNQVCA